MTGIVRECVRCYRVIKPGRTIASCGVCRVAGLCLGCWSDCCAVLESDEQYARTIYEVRGA